MSAQVQFWTVTALIVVGSYGWGHLALRLLDLGRTPGSLRREATPPMVVCVGVALFLAVGGFAVTAGIAYFSTMASWFCVGTVLALAPLTRVARRAREWQPDPRGALGAAVGGVVIALVVALAYGAAVNGPSNPNDDAAAYLYLAERLLRTGGLIDPFNFRRITSYDSGELFQAMFLRAAGSGAGLAAEWFLFGLLTAALFVGRMGRRYAVTGLLAAGAIVAVVHPVGATVNVAPAFSGVALTLALLRLLAVPAAQHDTRRYLLAGLFVGALCSLRYAFAIPAAVVVLTTAMVLEPRAALRRIALAGTVAVASVLGWAIALAKSSGTPLYPFISGNATSASMWRDPAVHSLGAYLTRLGHEMTTDGWAIEVALALAGTLLVAATARRKRRHGGLPAEVVVLLGAIGGCATLLGVSTYTLSGAAYSGIGRYNAPSTLATLLCVVDLLWRDGETVRASITASLRAVVHHRAPARALLAAAAALTVVLVTPPAANASKPSAKPIRRAVDQAGADLVSTTRALVDGDAFVDDWARYSARYQEISDEIPAGSKVLAAVDYPGLLDFNRFSFATLDEVGAASPPPHLPSLDLGPNALIAYLKGLGYSGIVASTTEAPGLYGFSEWHPDLSSGTYDVRLMAREFSAWSTMLSELSHDRALHVARAPTLVYYGFGS